MAGRASSSFGFLRLTSPANELSGAMLDSFLPRLTSLPLLAASAGGAASTATAAHHRIRLGLFTRHHRPAARFWRQPLVKVYW